MAKYRKPGSPPKKSTNPVDQEDAFVAKTLEVSHWAQRNRPILTLGLVVVALGVAGFVYYGRYTDTLNAGAASQLEELQQRLDAGDQTGVQADLQLFLERFGGTPFADEARIALAQVSTDLGDPNAAVDVLAPLARDVGSPLGAQAAGLLASIYEDTGNTEAAEGLYLRLADRAQLAFMVRDALADAARLRRDSGDAAGAVELYDRLLDEMDETDPDRGLMEMHRAEVAVVAARNGTGSQ